jgi:hypothetical protein
MDLLHRHALLGGAVLDCIEAPFPPDASAASASSWATHLLNLLHRGCFVKALLSPLGTQLLAPDDQTCEETPGRVREFLASAPEGEASAAAAAVIAVGAAALSLFAHANWTGAPVCSELEGSTQAVARTGDVLAALGVDGESAYELLDAPGLLCAARALLITPLEALDAASSESFAVPWWAARCAMLHQRCLADNSPTLERFATRMMRQAVERLAECTEQQASASSVASEVAQGLPPLPPAAPAAAMEVGEVGVGPLTGCAIMVVGLEGRPELNGQHGHAGKLDTAKGRVS